MVIVTDIRINKSKGLELIIDKLGSVYFPLHRISIYSKILKESELERFKSILNDLDLELGRDYIYFEKPFRTIILNLPIKQFLELKDHFNEYIKKNFDFLSQLYLKSWYYYKTNLNDVFYLKHKGEGLLEKVIYCFEELKKRKVVKSKYLFKKNIGKLVVPKFSYYYFFKKVYKEQYSIEKDVVPFNKVKELLYKYKLNDKEKTILKEFINIIENISNKLYNKRISALLEIDLHKRKIDLNILEPVYGVLHCSKPYDIKSLTRAYIDIEIPLFKEKDTISWASVIIYNPKTNYEKRYALTIHNLKDLEELDLKLQGFKLLHAKDEKELVDFVARIIKEHDAKIISAYNYAFDLIKLREKGDFTFNYVKKEPVIDCTVPFFKRIKNYEFITFDPLNIMKIIGKGFIDLKLETIARYFNLSNFKKSLSYEELERLEKIIIDSKKEDERTKAFKSILKYSVQDTLILKDIVEKRINWVFEDIEFLSRRFNIHPSRVCIPSCILKLYEKKQLERIHTIEEFKKELIISRNIKRIINKRTKERLKTIPVKTQKKLEEILKVRYINLIDTFYSHFLHNFKSQRFGMYKNVYQCYVPIGELFSDILIDYYGKEVEETVKRMRLFRDNPRRLIFTEQFLRSLLEPIITDYMRIKENIKIIDALKEFLSSIKPTLFSYKMYKPLEKEIKKRELIINKLKRVFSIKYSNKTNINYEDFDRLINKNIIRIKEYLNKNKFKIVSKKGNLLYIIGNKEIDNSILYKLDTIDKLLVIDYNPIFIKFDKYNIKIEDLNYHKNIIEVNAIKDIVNTLFNDKPEKIEQIYIDYFQELKIALENKDLNKLWRYIKKYDAYILHDKNIGEILIRNECYKDIEISKNNFGTYQIVNGKIIYLLDSIYDKIQPDEDYYITSFKKKVKPFLNIKTYSVEIQLNAPL